MFSDLICCWDSVVETVLFVGRLLGGHAFVGC